MKEGQQFCEWAAVPEDRSTVCGKPATHFILDPIDPAGPFPVCDEHWEAMFTGKTIEIGGPEWEAQLAEMEKKYPERKAYWDEIRRRTKAYKRS